MLSLGTAALLVAQYPPLAWLTWSKRERRRKEEKENPQRAMQCAAAFGPRYAALQ
jgi:hypothetical protein